MNEHKHNIPTCRFEAFIAMANQARSIQELIDIEERADQYRDSFIKDSGKLQIALITNMEKFIPSI